MFQNYFKIALRNLLKHKGFSSINIIGLAIGMAACLLILQYVSYELSYENFFPNKENIYRVQLNQYRNNELIFKSSENYPGVGPALKKELPEVIDYARLYNLGAKNNVVITWNDAPNGPVKFKHRRFLYADSSFLGMFGYAMIAGNPTTALSEPLTMVISESYAKKYFGTEDPLGKMLHMKDDDFNDELCKVTGVFKDLPQNTHLKFDVLISYKTLFSRFERAPERYGTTWGRKDMYTYIQVKEGSDLAAMRAQFPAIIDKYSPDLKNRNRRDEFVLQPLTDIHLYSHLTDEAEANGNGNAVYFLLVIAFFIVVIAWVNYINLATARALERAREVGIRKVVGAVRGQLIRQFLIESTLINLAALLLSIAGVFLAMPYFNQLSGMTLSFDIWKEGWFLGAFAGLFLAGSFLAGIYPALVLSSFRPIVVLRGRFRNTTGGALMRKGLVVFQFAISVALIAGTFIVWQQMNYMQSQDLGFNPEQTMVVERPGIMKRDRDAYRQSVDAFKTDLREVAGIRQVTASTTVPGKKMRFKAPVRKYNDIPENSVLFTASGVDYDFMDAFEMKVIAGRAFSEEYGSDSDTATVLTKAGARLLGFEKPEDAIGQTLKIEMFRWNPIVVGVIEDYHQESLKIDTNPTLFYMNLHRPEYYMVKVNPVNIRETVTEISGVWDRNFPGNPFEYFFLDDYFNRQYENEQKFGNMFAVFAILAIIVGSLGLFGLSAFTAQQRTKEIGVRKVLGASVSGIIYLLSREVISLVAIANLIAWPLIYYVMDGWLSEFAYRVNVDWAMLLLAGVAVLLFALLTVSFETIKAANRNPVDSLQHE